MSGNGHGSPASIRAGLSHPVIDADGHWLEFRPVLLEQIRRVGGSAAADGLASVGSDTRASLSMSVDERRRRGVAHDAKAYELGEDGLITADDFRDFTFANAVRLWGTVNPAFFSGTVVEKAAAQVLGTA